MSIESFLVYIVLPLIGIIGIGANWIGPGGYFHTSWFWRLWGKVFDRK